MEYKVNKPNIALIDYCSFPDTKIYKDSIHDLIDALDSKNVEVYTLIIKKKQESNEINNRFIKGTLVINENQFDGFEDQIVDSVKKMTKCSEETNHIVVSTDPEILNIFKSSGFLTCMVHNGYNDVMSLDNSYEVSNLGKVKSIIKK